MSPSRQQRRGRPALAWLTADDVAAQPVGTAVSLELYGRHAPRTVGRITARTAEHLLLNTPRGEVTMSTTRIRRGRVVASLYEPGDPVLRRDLAEDIWRGGVVRTAGPDVLVEQIDGTFAWFAEGDLEPADARPTAVAVR